MWCLNKQFADKFLKGLQGGEIEPKKLIGMNSSQRKTFLEKYVGKENVKNVNTEFESKLLLKNQQRGIITWAKKYSGLSKQRRTDILSKIKKLETAMTPEQENGFLQDIIEKRLGVGVSEKEAKELVSLTNKAESLFDSTKEEWMQSEKYWDARLKVLDYLDNATPEVVAPNKWGIASKFTSSVLSVARAIKTGFDLSFPARQGAAYIGTKQWNSAFKNMFKYAGSDSAFQRLKISMMRNKYSKYAIDMKRDLGLTMLGETFTQREEQFASKFIKKIPFLKGSERAFTGFANDIRFNRFVDILDNLEKSGKGITGDRQAMKDLAQVIAAATGRGHLGGSEGAARSLATVLFSPRWLVSRLQTIANPIKKSGHARVEAIKSLARLTGVAASFLGLLKLTGAEVETDTRSSNFGKAKFGNTRVDMTGGLAPYITLFSRIGTLSTKSSTTGKITKLNEPGFGKQTLLDLVETFIESKASPFAAVVRDVFKGKDFEGNRIDIKDPKKFSKYLADQLLMPLVASDTYDIYKESSGDVKFTTLMAGASLFGFGVSNYGGGTAKWEQSESKELKQFKEKVGEDKFKQANEEYNKTLAEKQKTMFQDERYKKLSEDGKTQAENKLKANIKESIFKKYKFRYIQDRKSQSELRELDSLTK